jgi:hypothetical protein
MSGTFINDFVSNTINIAIAAAGEEQDGAAPQYEMQIMVHATRTYKKYPHLASHFLCTHIFSDLCG